MTTDLRKNPVFWLIWLILGAAVLAGSGMVVISLQGADRALPDIYHWEGERLDADFERARVAARLGLEAELVIVNGACQLTLRGTEAAALQLRLTSGSDAHQDRTATLSREADGIYRAECAPLTRGKWRVALQDSANTWALRSQVDEPAARIELRARIPEGPAA
jgi:hypothetical protein